MYTCDEKKSMQGFIVMHFKVTTIAFGRLFQFYIFQTLIVITKKLFNIKNNQAQEFVIFLKLD